MEKEATRPSELYESERGGAGGGGKFRKQPARKPPTTPYALPEKEIQRRGGRGWLSKIVDPASRLLSSGATRFLPSFLSKSAPIDSVDVSENDDSEVKPDANDEDQKHTSEIQILRSEEGHGGSCKEERGSKCGSDIEHVGNQLENSSNCSGLFEIEKLMKGKTFSRDELNRLTEILHSRVVDHSDVDGRGNKNNSLTAGAEAAVGVSSQENLKTTVEEQQTKYLNRHVGEISDYPLPSTIRDKIGASPIEIAKAYMGARASELGIGSESITLKNERSPFYSDHFASKSSIPSTSPKSPTCWPGSMVKDHHDYLTPQTQRARIGLHYLPRTPYSRTVYSRSASKLQSVGNRSLNVLSTHREQLQNPIYGDKQVMKTRSGILDDGFGSVGPIRRTRQKFVSVTPSRGFLSSQPARSGSFQTENADVSKGFLPTVEKNLEPGPSTSSTSKFQPVDSKGPSFSVGVSTVHPQSSEMARKILGHLDRIPKEKSSDLRLDTAWKRHQSYEFTTAMSNEQFSRPHAEDSDSHKNNNLLGRKFSAKGNEDARNSSPDVHPEQRRTAEATDVVNTNSLALNTVSGVVDFGRDVKASNTWTAMHFKTTSNSQEGNRRLIEKNQPLPLHNQIDGKDVSKLVHHPGTEVLNAQRKPPTHSFGSRPALTSISVEKPGPGFSFPVSTPGLFFEPPTPSIMPSLPTSDLPRPKEETTVPSYSFGSKESTSVVFSFPTMGIYNNNDASTPTFSFGSNKKKTKLSFRSIGKDAICY